MKQIQYFSHYSWYHTKNRRKYIPRIQGSWAPEPTYTQNLVPLGFGLENHILFFFVPPYPTPIAPYKCQPGE